MNDITRLLLECDSSDDPEPWEHLLKLMERRGCTGYVYGCLQIGLKTTKKLFSGRNQVERDLLDFSGFLFRESIYPLLYEHEEYNLLHFIRQEPGVQGGICFCGCPRTRRGILSQIMLNPHHEICEECFEHLPEKFQKTNMYWELRNKLPSFGMRFR